VTCSACVVVCVKTIAAQPKNDWCFFKKEKQMSSQPNACSIFVALHLARTPVKTQECNEKCRSKTESASGKAKIREMILLDTALCLFVIQHLLKRVSTRG